MPSQDHRVNIVIGAEGIQKLNDLRAATGHNKSQIIRGLIDRAFLMLVQGSPLCVSGQPCSFPASHPVVLQSHGLPPQGLPVATDVQVNRLPLAHLPSDGKQP